MNKKILRLVLGKRKEKLEKRKIEDFKRKIEELERGLKDMKNFENSPAVRFTKAMEELRKKRPDIVERAKKEYGDPPANCDSYDLEIYYVELNSYIDNALRKAEWGGWMCFG
jgi:DNA repair exonuclease SbcCD ATPase subunit